MSNEKYRIAVLGDQASVLGFKALGLEPEIARYKDNLTPAIILIPGKGGSLGIGMANVKKSVERAVGADIL